MIAEQQVVALEALLRPVPGADPSGRSLQYDEIYDRIKDARRADASVATRGIWDRDLKSANWKEVRQLCEDALIQETKDLQIAAWLMESWLHLEGLPGLRRGMEVLLQLSESYWEMVHPEISQGIDFRIAPFVWINEKVPASFGQLVVVDPQTDQSSEATWDEWNRALWLDKVGARSPDDEELKAEIAESHSIESFRGLCRKTPESFFRDTSAVLEDAIETTRALESFLDDRLGDESPSLVRFREGLAEILTWISVVMKEGSFRPDIVEVPVDTKEEEGSEPASVSSGNVPSVAESGAIRSRQEAYQVLLNAARYLKQVEPHSPTPYLVMKAVSWGDKTLDDLLREFVRKGLNLEALFTFLGIDQGVEEE